MTRRVLSIIAIVVTALLLQSTVFAELKLLGVRPELMYLVTIIIAILEGPQEGAVVGFAGGMAQDFMLNQPKGITALTLTLVGYSVGLARQYIVSPSPLLPTILVAVGTAAGLIFYQV
ncbi:MAG: rod shape-determining protein MreD, partial [Myxococcota bacterium]